MFFIYTNHKLPQYYHRPLKFSSKTQIDCFACNSTELAHTFYITFCCLEMCLLAGPEAVTQFMQFSQGESY